MLDPTKGGHKTSCTDIRGLQLVLTFIGGKVSEEYRRVLNETFLRYTAGDRTMIADIEEFAASDAPIHVHARDALARPPAVESAAAAPTIDPAADAPVEPGDIDGEEGSNIIVFSRMSPASRAAYIAALSVVVPMQERQSAAAMADAEAEYKRAEAKALVVRTEAEAAYKQAEAASMRAAASVNEVEAYGRRLSFDRQNAELEMAKQQRKRKAREEAEEAIERFAAATPADRSVQRYAFAAQIEPLFPLKRARDSYVAKLVKTPAPPVVPAQKEGVYVLKLEDGTYYVGASQDTDKRVAQHRAGQVAYSFPTFCVAFPSRTPLTICGDRARPASATAARPPCAWSPSPAAATSVWTSGSASRRSSACTSTASRRCAGGSIIRPS